MDKLIKIFEERLKRHKNDSFRYFNSHQNDKALISLGKMLEAKFILEKLMICGKQKK
jgi:hypothetical protein